MVVDSPPLTEVVDALPIARQVDDVLLVVRLGSSNLSRLQRLGDLLAQNGIEPHRLRGRRRRARSDEKSYYLSASRAAATARGCGGRFEEAPSRPVRLAVRSSA